MCSMSDCDMVRAHVPPFVSDLWLERENHTCRRTPTWRESADEPALTPGFLVARTEGDHPCGGKAEWRHRTHSRAIFGALTSHDLSNSGAPRGNGARRLCDCPPPRLELLRELGDDVPSPGFRGEPEREF